MASAQVCFDAEKTRREIFETRDRNISTTLEFAAEAAKVLKEKGREDDFLYIIDRSIKLLQGNLLVKRHFLLSISVKCYGKPECTGMLKCYLALEKLLNDSVNEKSLRIDILVKIGEVYFNTAHYRKAIEYTLKAENIVNELNEKSGEVNCCEILGNAYVRLAEYKKAMEYYSKALEISIKVGDRSGIANYNRSLGVTYSMMGQYEKTIEYCSKGLGISIEIGDQSGIAKNTGSLGNAYRCLGQYKKAIDCYSKALAINIEIGNQSGIATNTGNLGITYVSMGQYEKAITYFSKGLAINIQINDRQGIATLTSSLGNVYYFVGQYEKAFEYLNKGLAISIEIGDQAEIANNTRDLGTVYHSLGQYEKAIEYAFKGLSISIEIGDQSGIAISNGELGNAYVSIGQYKKAIRYYSKGLAIHSKIGNRPGVANITINLGNAYRCVGQYEEAIGYFIEGLAIDTEIGNLSGIASSNANLGNAYICIGQYEKAIGYYSISLEICIEIGDQSGIAKTTKNLGIVYCCLGQYEKAIEYQSKGLAISIEIGDQSGIANANANLGGTYMNMGQLEKAIAYNSKGLAISSEIGDRSGMRSNIVNLGRAHLFLGQYEKAVEYFIKCLEISIEIGDPPGRANVAANLGCAYYGLGQYEKAIAFYNESLTIATEIGDQLGRAICNRYLGMTNAKMGQYKKAIDLYNKGLEISTEIGDRLGIANIKENLGNVYYNLGQYEKAIEYCSKALAISIEIESPCLECISVGNIGRFYFTLHRITEDVSKLKKAVSFLKKSVVCGDKILFDLDADENKISFINQYFVRYVTLMHSFILLKRTEAALLVADLGKAKALHAFYEKRYKSETNDMSNYTRETWQKIDNIEEKVQTGDIEKVLQLKRSNCTVLFYAFDCDMFLNIWILNGEDRIRQKTIILEKMFVFPYLKEILEHFSVDLNRDSSFYKHDFCVNPRKQKIAEKSFGKMLITGKSTHDKKVSKKQNLNTAENKLSKKFPSCDNIFSHKTSDDPLKMEIMKILEHYDLAIDTSKILITPLEALFRILIKPVEKFIQGSKLIIVPDALLFFAPFCAFQKENGCPISKDYSIQITPSLHTLCVSTTQSHEASLGFALFVGNPSVGKVMFRGEQIEPSNLSNATAEAKCLARLFDAKPLVEGEAVKERVLRLIHGASIVHIAAHGDQKRGEIFLAPNPDLNYQGWSLPKEESYLVREKDIIDIRTNALLVVLCCCHTGSGKISSEGVIGVARAFLAAGARSVLATLWPIHDEGTRLFMEYFYNEICKETSICEALRKTMNIFQQHENSFIVKFRFGRLLLSTERTSSFLKMILKK